MKGPLYARFGILEYWLVDLERQTVEVFGDPDSATGAYRRSRTPVGEDILASDALPQVTFAVRELFA